MSRLIHNRAPIFTPSDWYWIVGGDETRLFSSIVSDYVTPDNAAYTSWLATGMTPTRIDSEASLWDVLAVQAPANLPVAIPAAIDALATVQIAEMSDGARALLQALSDRVSALEGKPTISLQTQLATMVGKIEA